LQVVPDGQQVPEPHWTVPASEAQDAASGTDRQELVVVSHVCPAEQHHAPQLTGNAVPQAIGGGGSVQIVPLHAAPAAQQPVPQATGHDAGTLATRHAPATHVTPAGQQAAPQPTG
jgi:hypothetical protein